MRRVDFPVQGTNLGLWVKGTPLSTVPIPRVPRALAKTKLYNCWMILFASTDALGIIITKQEFDVMPETVTTYFSPVFRSPYVTGLADHG